jgi:hypothetical protein
LFFTEIDPATDIKLGVRLSYAALSLLSLIWLTRHNFRLYLFSQHPLYRHGRLYETFGEAAAAGDGDPLKRNIRRTDYQRLGRITLLRLSN